MSYEQSAEIAGKAAYASAGGTFVAGISLNEWAIIIGIVATVVTLLMNWYYKQKHLDLARGMSRPSMDDGG